MASRRILKIVSAAPIGAHVRAFPRRRAVRKAIVASAIASVATLGLLGPGLRGDGAVEAAANARVDREPSPTIAPVVLAEAVTSAPTSTADPAGVSLAAALSVRVPAPVCRAVLLVHGGGYFAGDAGALEVSFAAPLREHGYRVWNVEYPMLADWPDVAYDKSQPWYPRPDVDSTPSALRTVHDRAVDAIAPTVTEMLATGCDVTLLGVSAGGSIVADLAHRFPAVDRAVLVVGASLTPDRIGGAPLEIFYGGADEVVLPRASIDTCARWVAAGSSCTAHRFEDDGHLSAAPPAVALASLLDAS